MSDQSEIVKSNGDAPLAAQARHRDASEVALPLPVDIYETGDGITLKADMPGVSKERLNLQVDGKSLLVEGSIGLAPQEKMTALYADVRSTRYRRRFELTSELETNKIAANLKDGELTVHIPKRAELRARRIEVQT